MKVTTSILNTTISIKAMTIYLSSVLILISLGCSTVDSQVQNSKPDVSLTDVFVFIDKSKSVTYTNPEVAAIAEKEFRNAMNQATQPKDRISIYYIHDNTSGSSELISYELPPYVLPPNPNTIQKNNYNRAYQNTVVKAKANLLGKFLATLKEPNDAGTQKGTDVVGALERVSQRGRQGAQKHIFLFTDGIQTKNGLSGNFKDIQEAVQKAKKDQAAIVKKYSIVKDQLSGATAIMILPYTPIGSSHNVYLNHYWKSIFENFGAKLEVK